MAGSTKYHVYICEGFRWASFALVVLTLLLWLMFFWAGWPSLVIVKKLFTTTLAFLVAAVVTKAIFTDPVPKPEAKPLSPPSS